MQPRNFTFSVSMQRAINKGRRWTITINMDTLPRIATKRANTTHHKWSIIKEGQLIRFLNSKNIPFVATVTAIADDSFSYERIQGDLFSKIFTSACLSEQKQYIEQIIHYAYTLDTLWIVHGELDDPRTNLIVDANKKIRLIDFERGWSNDFTGKNLRHVAQWLYRLRYLDLETVQQLWNQSIEDIYFRIQQTMNSNTSTIKNSVARVLLGLVADQGTKRLFFNQQRWASSTILTPMFNTGIGRSIPIALPVIIILSIIMIGFCCRLLPRERNYRTIILLILAWALGNVIDRIRLGGVRDFIDLQYRPVFNVADIYLSIGCFLLIRKERKISEKLRILQ